jgi:dTDP-4-dehydrorhamnose reductase
MRAIVLGANGMLGKTLVQELPRSGIEVVAAFGHGECDIRDAAAVMRAVASARPDVVYNAAGYTNVDKAESEPEVSYQVNAIGPENVARACTGAGAVTVHYSTDFVFDGEQERLYDERDPPSPQGVYARGKTAGDKLVLAANPRSFVLRVGCVYDWGGRNFPSVIVPRLRAGESVRADQDRRASPTWTRSIARVSAAVAATQHFGLHHCTSNGETSWADFARFMAAELGVPSSRVEDLSTGGLRLPAPRPRRAILDNRMLREHGLDTMGTWQEEARAYLAAEPRGGR